MLRDQLWAGEILKWLETLFNFECVWAKYTVYDIWSLICHFEFSECYKRCDQFWFSRLVIIYSLQDLAPG